MRAWTKSACVVFAWSILAVVLVAAVVAFHWPVQQAQAGTRTPNSRTQVQVAARSAQVQVAAGSARVSPGGSGQVGVVSVLSVAAAPVTPAHPVRYVVHAGDTLAGIAERFGVAGGWPVLYAANRRAVGGDPDVIHAGTVLVMPGAVAPARYTVVAGDSLAGIAARFGVAGGWPVLYAANRHRIGPDPDVVRAGLVLATPHRPVPGAGRTRPQHLSAPRPAPVRPVRPVPAQHPVPAISPGSRPRAVAGMPGWLKTTLLAAGLLIAAAFVTEPLLVARRRHQVRATAVAAPPGLPGPHPGTCGPPGSMSSSGPLAGTPGPAPRPGAQPGSSRTGPARPGSRRPGSLVPAPVPVPAGKVPVPAGAGQRRPAGRPGPIVLADHDRLVVTRCQSDDTVYVLRPPGADPQAILRVASLVLPERRYGELAEQLGVPASWPMD